LVKKSRGVRASPCQLLAGQATRLAALLFSLSCRVMTGWSVVGAVGLASFFDFASIKNKMRQKQMCLTIGWR